MNEVAQVWDELAAWWDEDIQDGDIFHRNLIFVPFRDLVNLLPGHELLDIGCGNGALLRYLYRNDVNFVGADYSCKFLALAQKRSRHLNIKYCQADATDLMQLKNLNRFASKKYYDYITCSMVVHDLPELASLVEAANSLLVIGGKMLVSLPHPVFNSVYSEILDGNKIAMSGYETIAEKMLKAKLNQPWEHHNFHRPLNKLCAYWLNRGFVIKNFVEPSAANMVTTFSKDYLWSRLRDFPPVAIICFQKVEEYC